MSPLIVLHISNTLIGTIAEPRPLATWIVLLTGTIDGEALLFWRRRRAVLREGTTVMILILFFDSALIVCSITLLVPRCTGVHKLAGTIAECAESWSRCEVSWDQWMTARWRCWGAAVTGTVVLSIAAIHRCNALNAIISGGRCRGGAGLLSDSDRWKQQ